MRQQIDEADLEPFVHLPAVGRDTEIALSRACLLECAHESLERAGRYQAVAAEFGMPAVAEDVRIDHRVAPGTAASRTKALHAPPVRHCPDLEGPACRMKREKRSEQVETR